MILLHVILLLGTAFSAPIEPIDHPDRVTNLPGAPSEPSFPLYSGFLNAEDNGTEHRLFYVLCEAIHANPANTPLLVWLNGGPGSSSLFGFLLIHGPYLINADSGDLRYNQFSWNQYANVLYLETPTGVGFSHTNNAVNLTYNDANTARINRKALHDFMTRLHPRYAKRDFYITGESYAGVYNPYFAREILRHAKSGEFTNANFKGIAMGNAHVDNYSDLIASSLQLYSLGMIPEQFGKELFAAWEKILDGYHEPSLSKELLKEISRVNNFLGSNAPYDLPLQCNKKENDTVWHIAKPSRVAECESEALMEAYMNREDVQIRMHVRTADQPAVPWKSFSDEIFNKYESESDTTPIYRDILAAAGDHFRILFYTGDMDLVCPPLQVAFGAKKIAAANGMKVMETQAWTYLSDFGGARTSYATNDSRISIDVLTVRGAGHMVPMTLPDRAFQLINNFISTEAKATIDYSKTILRKQNI